MRNNYHIDQPRKIILFPFSGGSKFSYNNLFPNNFDVSVIEYPGRGLKANEQFITDIHDLVDNLLCQVKEEIKSHEEYIIYGHSMGALVGYLMCKEIQNLGLKRPIRLVVSGSKSPNLARREVISDLPDMDFWKEIIKFGGIPEGFDKHPALVQFYTPILRADFKCAESLQYDEKSFRMSVPIDVFYGTDEGYLDQEIKDWQIVTTGRTKFKKFEGNHFFIFNHKEFFIEYFNKLQVNATI